MEVCGDMPVMQGCKEPVSSPPWLKASERQHIDKPTITYTQGTTCEQHMGVWVAVGLGLLSSQYTGPIHSYLIRSALSALFGHMQVRILMSESDLLVELAMQQSQGAVYDGLGSVEFKDVTPRQKEKWRESLPFVFCPLCCPTGRVQNT